MEYVSYDLLEPETAKNLLRRITGEIETLDTMPLRYSLFHEEPWLGRGLRFFAVGNYLVFYTPEEKSSTVYIVRVIYGGRNIQEQLQMEH